MASPVDPRGTDRAMGVDGLLHPTKEQQAPKPNQGTPIWDLVMADMKDRDQLGRTRYGTPLQAHNGRDPLVDLYQELLDAVVYLRQAIEERKAPGG